MLVPSKEEFLVKTGGTRPMAVYRDVLADIETPVSAYWKLAHDQVHSFLLESVTGGENVSRYSFLGIRPRFVLKVKNSVVHKESCGKAESWNLEPGEDPLDALQREMFAEAPVPVPGLPTFVGGAVGLLSYDIVRYFERLPDSTEDDLQVDDLAMMMADTVVAFDHAKNLIRVLSMTDGSAEGYDRAAAEIDAILRRLAQPLPPSQAAHSNPMRSRRMSPRRASRGWSRG